MPLGYFPGKKGVPRPGDDTARRAGVVVSDVFVEEIEKDEQGNAPGDGKRRGRYPPGMLPLEELLHLTADFLVDVLPGGGGRFLLLGRGRRPRRLRRPAVTGGGHGDTGHPLGDITRPGQLETLAAVGPDHEDYPQDKAGDADDEGEEGAEGGERP